MADSSQLVSVWPCDHGGVLVEPVAVPRGMTCARCGAHPEHYVRLDDATLSRGLAALMKVDSPDNRRALRVALTREAQ